LKIISPNSTQSYLPDNYVKVNNKLQLNLRKKTIEVDNGFVKVDFKSYFDILLNINVTDANEGWLAKGL
jgi:hypothetical protein